MHSKNATVNCRYNINLERFYAEKHVYEYGRVSVGPGVQVKEGSGA